MTGAMRERLKQELGGGTINDFQVNEGGQEEVRYEDFVAWLGARESTELADQLKRHLAMLKWSLLGPLLVYEPEREEVSGR